MPVKFMITKKEKFFFFFLIFFYFRRRLFRRPIIAQPDHVIVHSKAVIALHNYLQMTESSFYCPAGFVNEEDGVGNVVTGGWRADEDACIDMQTLSRTSSNK